MKEWKSWLVLLTMFLGFVSCTAFGQDAAAARIAERLKVPVATLQVLKDAPAMDAVPDFKTWAGPLDFRHLAGFIKKPPLDTRGYLARDEQHLYLAVRCEDPAAKEIAAKPVPLDGDVWAADSAEFMLLPGYAPDQAYYHLAVNPAGSLYDTKVKDKTWNSGAKVFTAIDATGWLAVIRVPLVALGVKEGEWPALWRVNLHRGRPTRGGIPALDLAWSPTHSPQNHVPAWFGLVSCDTGKPRDVAAESAILTSLTAKEGTMGERKTLMEQMLQSRAFEIPTTSDYAVSVHGRPVAVYEMPTRYGQAMQNGKPVSVYDGQPLRRPMYFACADIGAPATVTVEIGFLPAGAIRSVTAHPLSRGIALRREGARVTFEVDRPGTVTLMVNGDHTTCPLHLFFSPPVEAPPEGAIVFGPGYHDLGYDNAITLTDGQTLYLAPGAWVEGVVRAKNARNIRIMGRGILSQRRPESLDYSGAVAAPQGIVLDTCQDVSISGIVVTRGIGGWCSLAANCDRVDVRDFHVLASVLWSADGFNPCNSRNVSIERSFIRSGDDCIAIKGNTGPSILTHPHEPPAGQPPVENICVRGCVFWSDHNQVLVIGCETRARHIRKIRFSDCDVLVHSAGNGLGVFGIVPLHGTDIRDIVYEEIRVEHCEEQLFCFRFVESIFNIPGDLTFPGGIAEVVIRNISVRHQKGGPRSEFTGYAPDKRIENVRIDGLRYGGKAVQDAAGMGLKANAHVADVRFVPVE